MDLMLRDRDHQIQQLGNKSEHLSQRLSELEQTNLKLSDQIQAQQHQEKQANDCLQNEKAEKERLLCELETYRQRIAESDKVFL